MHVFPDDFEQCRMCARKSEIWFFKWRNIFYVQNAAIWYKSDWAREMNEIHQIINKTHLHIVDNLQKKTAERNVSGLFNANIHDGAFYFWYILTNKNWLLCFLFFFRNDLSQPTRLTNSQKNFLFYDHSNEIYLYIIIHTLCTFLYHHTRSDFYYTHFWDSLKPKLFLGR